MQLKKERQMKGLQELSISEAIHDECLRFEADAQPGVASDAAGCGTFPYLSHMRTESSSSY